MKRLVLGIVLILIETACGGVAAQPMPTLTIDVTDGVFCSNSCRGGG